MQPKGRDNRRGSPPGRLESPGPGIATQRPPRGPRLPSGRSGWSASPVIEISAARSPRRVGRSRLACNYRPPQTPGPRPIGRHRDPRNPAVESRRLGCPEAGPPRRTRMRSDSPASRRAHPHGRRRPAGIPPMDWLSDSRVRRSDDRRGRRELPCRRRRTPAATAQTRRERR